MFQIKKRIELLQSLNQFLNTLYSEITEQLQIVSPIYGHKFFRIAI